MVGHQPQLPPGLSHWVTRCQQEPAKGCRLRDDGRLTRDWDYTSIRTETDESITRLFAHSTEADHKVVDRVAAIASGRGFPRAEDGVGVLLSKLVITAPIVGAAKLHHLYDALASVNVKLSADEITSLEEPYVPHAVVGFV